MNIKKLVTLATVGAVLGQGALASAGTCTTESSVANGYVSLCNSQFYWQSGANKVWAYLGDPSPQYPIYYKARIRGVNSSGSLISGCDASDTTQNGGWASATSNCSSAVKWKGYVSYFSLPR